MMRFIYIITMVMTFVSGCNHHSENPYKEDIAYFFETIRTTHPDPYQYITKDSFDSLEKSLLQNVDKFRTLKDLNLALLQCNQYFDGHTRCGIGSKLFTLIGNYYLPLEVRNDSLFWMPTGESVVAVDSFATKRYIDEMKQFVSFDLSEIGRNKKCVDYVSFALLNNLKPPRYFDLYKNGEVYRKEFVPRLFVKEKKESLPPFVFRFFQEDSMAYLGYNSAGMKYKELLVDTLKTFFDSINRYAINHLFIDVRNNGGGSDLTSAVLMKHLYTNEYGLDYCYQTTNRGKRELLKQVWNMSLNFREKNEMLKNKIKTYFRPLQEERHVFVASNFVGYDKNIYVLQGYRTFSAAYNFCRMVRLGAPFVKLVGDMVGQYNPICANSVTFYLPNSRIPFSVATSKNLFKNDLPEKNGFLMPDIPFVFQYQDSLTMEEMKRIKNIR